MNDDTKNPKTVTYEIEEEKIIIPENESDVEYQVKKLKED